MSVQSQLDNLQASCKKKNHNVVQMRGAASKKEYEGTNRNAPLEPFHPVRIQGTRIQSSEGMEGIIS